MIWPLIPYAKLIAAGVVVLVLSGTHWKAYSVGKKGEQTKAVALELKQTSDLATSNENQRHLERANGALISKAQNDRVTKEQSLQAVVIASRGELNGLRDTIRGLNSSASSESLSACVARANTARDVFEQSAERYTDLAKSADGHAADAVMLRDAWPK